MDITLDKQSTTDGLIKITLTESDYQPKVEEKVKEYSRKANIKGFRAGKVPSGVIKKMFGKSILVEEVNHLISHSVSDYIKDNKLRIIGDPLPNQEKARTIDWDTQKSFEFEFQVGMVEDFQYELSPKVKLKSHSIEVDEAVIQETLELLAASLAPAIRLDTRLEAGDAAIVGDATQLHQVAMNLCTNALQAMQQGGVLEVSLQRADLAQARELSHGNLAPGAYVRLRVSDTGSGIAPHVLDRMFDPFFTTKGVGEGTGLGLSLVHGIVADLGGAIDVHTALGRGTTFAIWLPLSGQAAARPDEADAELPRGHGQTILIVDDEKPLVALAEEMLAALGYEPIGFSSSLAALQAVREAPQRFDAVLTDETMPELIGTELAREIRQLRPDIAVVLMSGYSGAQLHERAQAVGIREVLHKPLQSRDIAECFGRVLRPRLAQASTA